jgi:uncharacterized protein YegJ (DUF2314 family)
MVIQMRITGMKYKTLSQNRLWRLDSAVNRSELDPDNFKIPSLAARQDIKVGYLVKLVFMNEKRTERMWVRVDSRKGKTFYGKLDSTPVFMKEMFKGERVVFGPEHICSITE